VDVGDTLAYTATLDTNAPLPGWLSFNAATRTFSGTPGAGDVGTIAVKVTATDGTSASVSDIFNIVVGNTNDAPVIQNVGGTVPVGEDASVLLQAPSALVTDADGDTLTMTVSVSHGTLTASQAILDAIAAHTLTGIDGDGSDGSLSVSGSASAITAAIQAGVTYAPAANYNGSDTLDVAISDGQATPHAPLNINVTPVNDAPVLNAAATPVLAAENEDAGAPVGAVGTLVSSLVNLNPPAGGLDNVTDADSGALTGIALTATNTTNGAWFYSTNNGGSWTAVGAIADNSALLLAADNNTRLYFQPNANFSGAVSGAITFRAWDQTSGTAGSKVDTTTNGGASAFSATTDTADITINAVNDARHRRYCCALDFRQARRGTWPNGRGRKSRRRQRLDRRTFGDDRCARRLHAAGRADGRDRRQPALAQGPQLRPG
jgi:large repetitive protein